MSILVREAVSRFPSAIDVVCAAVAADPSAIALVCGAARKTYGELMSDAVALAHELSERGANREEPVALCLDRSFEFVTAMLAAQVAGGAALPLDPAWPDDRLNFILEDSRTRIVVTSSRYRARIRAAGTICIGETAPTDRPRRFAPAHFEENDLAYIIYTSGSTGEPKGVEITQANLSGLVRWHLKAFHVTANDRASSVAGLGFDAAIWEIWPYLAAGASVTLADESARHAPAALRRWLIEQRITHAFVPTPLAEPMLVASWPRDCALRYLLTGGDTLHRRPAEGLPFVVVNNYGPTECTVVATSGVVGSAGDDVPSIGSPIDGVRIHLLDAKRRPVARGEIGEIYIGGVGVGRGYRNRPAMTVERFIADPFVMNSDRSRLYRTGDLARVLPDGQLAFLGRNDDQIKLRGHRIELDEISAALDRHPAVAQSVVALRGDGAEMQLVAYVVEQPRASSTVAELRDYLASRLPDYMLPSVFVRLAALPLTTSGKVDRSALPEPSAENAIVDAAYREPATVIEERVATIVAELLKLDRVGSEDNFFLLGGHSLLGTQLVLRSRDAFGVELTLRDLFRAQTVARLAARIEQLLLERLGKMSEQEARALLVS